MSQRILFSMIVLACSTFGAGQKSIDWKPCTDITDQFKKQVDQFNATHKDGFSIMLMCTYSGDPASPKRNQPKQIVHLSASEIAHLHALRKIEDSAFAAMDEYEKYLFRTHKVHKPEIGEPCYYFAGIVVETDYITIDPTPMDVTCN